MKGGMQEIIEATHDYLMASPEVVRLIAILSAKDLSDCTARLYNLGYRGLRLNPAPDRFFVYRGVTA